jgi:alkanesulfonate monooxygenase SsuD/methylene tetrahydromethanopterin reductase-like flavin-dependent oxidoreductase (luciferase family)
LASASAWCWSTTFSISPSPSPPWIAFPTGGCCATEEAIGALRACWTQEDSEFHGQFFDFDPIWSFPKPAQTPHPPILMGAAGKLGFEHTIRWADEWMPMDLALGNVPKRVGRFREAAAAAGRDIPITMVMFGDPSPEILRQYRDLGVTRTIIGAARTGWDQPDTTLDFLRSIAPHINALK